MLCVLVFVAEMLNADNVLALGTWNALYGAHSQTALQPYRRLVLSAPL